MKYILLSLLLISCASKSTKPEYEKDLISVGSALDLARSSYIKGCVFQGKKYNPKVAHFPECVIKAKEHQKEIHSIMKQ